MKLGVKVGLGPGHSVRCGSSSLSPKGHIPSIFRPVCCGQTGGWINMPLGMGDRPRPTRHCVRWGPGSLSAKRGRSSLPPTFLPMYSTSQKTSHLWLAIILTHKIRLRYFLHNFPEKVRNQRMLCFPISPLYCFCITLQNMKPRRQRTAALCVQHNPTPAALSASSLESCPHQPFGLNALITWFMELYSIVRVVSQKRLKKLNSWLNSGNALIQHLSENAIFVFLRFAR